MDLEIGGFALRDGHDLAFDGGAAGEGFASGKGCNRKKAKGQTTQMRHTHYHLLALGDRNTKLAAPYATCRGGQPDMTPYWGSDAILPRPQTGDRRGLCCARKP
ncbi:hypothetical protein MACH21_33580 [Roseicyclus marinus]|uniref:Uncharacterized protein n=1 Tax=Roseicyclus marinus TaxID=2161673 RepID=A0AA48KPH8_9RHOB|nr:hypothetical protein MACH21_33580 [Roseicyclus marinus]